MSISEQQFREEICHVGRWIHEQGLVAGCDGNISVRLDEQRILCTPTAMSKGRMSPADMAVVDPAGRKLCGERNPSSEIAMHLLIYRIRPDVRAVVHAHPPTATGYAAAGIALDQALVSEIIISLGAVPLARYGTPGTPELAAALEPLIPHYDAILMANHGVVCFAEDLTKAFYKMETVEHFAKISLVTEMLGRQQVLSPEQISKLLVQRTKYEGFTSSAPLRPCSTGNNHEEAAAKAAPRETAKPVSLKR